MTQEFIPLRRPYNYKRKSLEDKVDIALCMFRANSLTFIEEQLLQECALAIIEEHSDKKPLKDIVSMGKIDRQKARKESLKAITKVLEKKEATKDEIVFITELDFSKLNRSNLELYV